MWQIVKQTVKPIFSGSKAAVKFWGSAILLLLGAVVTTVYMMTVFGGNVRYDAIAVWQNDGGDSWDIVYSIYSADKNQWTTRISYPAGTAGDNTERIGLVGALEGDDQDPDISSAKQRAIVVWSNSGASGNAGSDIFYAVWGMGEKGEFAWSMPERLASLPYDDYDPTIYMPDGQNALAVWINKGVYEEKLYFAEYKNNKWSSPEVIQMPFTLNTITGPELAFSDINTRYLLSFTARDGTEEKPFLGVYANGAWSVAQLKTDFPARVDESVPNTYRTASVMDDSMKLHIAYTGKDDSLWLYALTGSDDKNKKPKRLASDATRPGLLADSAGARVLYSEPASLAEVDESGKEKIFVATTENGNTRIDAVNLYSGSGKKSLALWSSQSAGGSDIKFSTYSSKWTEPEFIENKYVGDDLAPAVTPIEVVVGKDKTIRKEEQLPIDWAICGNGVIDDPIEECEIGVSCAAASDMCDWDVITNALGKAFAAAFASCECTTPDDMIDGGNTGKNKKQGRGGSLPRFPNPFEGLDAPNVADVSVYSGAACGFDKLTIVKEKEDEVMVTFTPASSSGDTESFTLNDSGSWSVTNTTGTMKIFPKAGVGDQPSAIVFLEIGPDTVKMRGLDASNGFQLCDGKFIEDASATGGNLKPAPAQ